MLQRAVLERAVLERVVLGRAVPQRAVLGRAVLASAGLRLVWTRMFTGQLRVSAAWAQVELLPAVLAVMRTAQGERARVRVWPMELARVQV
ncbi:MAG TPA: hypothetical protein VGL05_32670 [Kribbella sp.]